MNDKIEITGMQEVIDAAARSAVRDAITKSPVIVKRVGEIVDQVLKDNTTMIEAAVVKALSEALADPSIIGPMIRSALIASGSMMEGQFNAVMKKVGKDLALDRRTLTELAEVVKKRIAAGDEALGMGMFS